MRHESVEERPDTAVKGLEIQRFGSRCLNDPHVFGLNRPSGTSNFAWISVSLGIQKRTIGMPFDFAVGFVDLTL